MSIPREFERLVAFHGHTCLDIAMGYRVTTAALRELGCARPSDDELVAVAECDSCSVDAVQAVTGCTLGKGNLILKDYGKAAFTFYHRPSGKALRIYCHYWEAFDRQRGRTFQDAMNRVLSGLATVQEQRAFQTQTTMLTEEVLAAPESALFTVTPIQGEPPLPARLWASAACAACGEWTMETRLHTVGARRLCGSCAGGA